MGKPTTCAVRHAGLRRRATAVGAGLLVPVLLAACGTDGDPDDPANRLLFSPDATPEQTGEATQAAPSGPTLPDFPDTCSDLVSTSDVVTIVGRPLPGETTFVFADALPDIGRTARVTCGYGVQGGQDAEPAVEITVNDYRDESSAQDRIDVTLEAAAQAGDRVGELTVGPYQGWVLRDEDGATAVVDAGTRTLVVSMERRLVPRRAENVVLTQLAERALGVATETPTENPAG